MRLKKFPKTGNIIYNFPKQEINIAMKIIGKEKLHAFMQKNARSRKPLTVWLSDAQSSNWRTPQDIKNAYRSADFLSDNRVIFNIGGNHYRLIVQVRYCNGIVKIDWVGTHTEYDKLKL